jgi:hypothetical protein
VTPIAPALAAAALARGALAAVLAEAALEPWASASAGERGTLLASLLQQLMGSRQAGPGAGRIPLASLAQPAPDLAETLSTVVRAIGVAPEAALRRLAVRAAGNPADLAEILARPAVQPFGGSPDVITRLRDVLDRVQLEAARQFHSDAPVDVPLPLTLDGTSVPARLRVPARNRRGTPSRTGEENASLDVLVELPAFGLVRGLVMLDAARRQLTVHLAVARPDVARFLEPRLAELRTLLASGGAGRVSLALSVDEAILREAAAPPAAVPVERGQVVDARA